MHNAMATIEIYIIRTRVLRNERLFSGSSDSLNRARPFPFEIRHTRTQCTFCLIVSYSVDADGAAVVIVVVVVTIIAHS